METLIPVVSKSVTAFTISATVIFISCAGALAATPHTAQTLAKEKPARFKKVTQHMFPPMWKWRTMR
jgi:hypothetical protein